MWEMLGLIKRIEHFHFVASKGFQAHKDTGSNPGRGNERSAHLLSCLQCEQIKIAKSL